MYTYVMHMLCILYMNNKSDVLYVMYVVYENGIFYHRINFLEIKFMTIDFVFLVLLFIVFRYFKIHELEAEADFPEELSKFEEVCDLLIR